MGKRLYFLLQLLLISLLLSTFVYLGETKSKNFTVTVTVEPMRTIIVDKNIRIVQIMSNTREDVEPLVFLETRDGVELPYTEGVRDQYLSLKPIINFSQPGIVYERDDRIVMALFKTGISWIQKVFMINFQIR
jgi:hypothetical protein